MGCSVVLIHGGGTTARQWDLVTSRLAAPALAPDVPGRGGRPADLERLTLPAAIESLAADVGPADPIVLVAHSSPSPRPIRRRPTGCGPPGAPR